MSRILTLALAAALAACSTDPVRLYELRQADLGTPRRLAYEQLESAVELANQFLEESPRAHLFPAEEARFKIDFTDVVVYFKGEGWKPLRIYNTGWADPRTMPGDDSHPAKFGFMVGPTSETPERGDELLASHFFQRNEQEMAAILLRQAALMREYQARGSFDFWMNMNFLGLVSGWEGGNPVSARAYAVESAYWSWLRGAEPRVRR